MLSEAEVDSIDHLLCRKAFRDYAEDIFDTELGRSKRRSRDFYADKLCRLRSFIDNATVNSEIPFQPRLSSNGSGEYDCSPLAHQYFPQLAGFIEVVKMLSPKYEYDEHITVFTRCSESMGLLTEDLSQWGVPSIWKASLAPFDQLGYPNAGVLYNALVVNIRNAWTPDVQKKARERQRNAQKRADEYCAYADALFDDCVRQVVLRIDLLYKKELFDCVDIHDAVRDLDHMLANQRNNRIFKFLKGYIAKFEYGVEKGIHIHLILFFDGSKRNNASHIHLAKQIGEYWVHTITKGRGAYWNCNAKDAYFEKLGIRGIGVINAQETSLRDNLKQNVIGYLCKTEQFMKPKFGPNVKLMRRGLPPKIPDVKRGRPRKVIVSQLDQCSRGV